MDETSPLIHAQNHRATQIGSYWSINDTLRRAAFSLLFALCLYTIISNWQGAVEPECHIEKLHVLALDKASNETQIINGTSIFFDLIFKNVNSFGKIYSETVNITFYYHGNSLSLPIGNISIPKFVIENEVFVLPNERIQTFGLQWADAARLDVINGSTAFFGITLDTKFRSSTWYSNSPREKIYGMSLKVNTTVNDHGASVEDKVWLSPPHGSGLISTLLIYALIVFIVIPLFGCLCCCCLIYCR